MFRFWGNTVNDLLTPKDDTYEYNYLIINNNSLMCIHDENKLGVKHICIRDDTGIGSIRRVGGS